jgi:hypothetical protein
MNYWNRLNSQYPRIRDARCQNIMYLCIVFKIPNLNQNIQARELLPLSPRTGMRATQITAAGGALVPQRQSLRGFGARCQHCSRQWGKKGRRSSFPWSITTGHGEYKGGWLCVLDGKLALSHTVIIIRQPLCWMGDGEAQNHFSSESHPRCSARESYILLCAFMEFVCNREHTKYKFLIAVVKDKMTVFF